MNIVLFDNDINRMSKNLSFFIKKNNISFAAVRGLEMLKSISPASDITVLYMSDTGEPDERLAEIISKTRGVVCLTGAADGKRLRMTGFAYGAEWLEGCPVGEELYERIISGYKAKEKIPEDFDSRLTFILKKCRIPQHLKGYEYIKAAVAACHKDNSYCFGITKMIYPKLSVHFKTSPQCIERAIRNAIDVGWNMENEFYEALFYTLPEKRPTNSMFLRAVINYINMYEPERDER